eukprot:6204777-Pleurochrysis_carterae.AAC.16
MFRWCRPAHLPATFPDSDEVDILRGQVRPFTLPHTLCSRSHAQDRGSLYMVLEHVPGGELWAQTHKRGLPLSVATFYCAELLEVLQHLHEHGVIHRDLKPENVREARARLHAMFTRGMRDHASRSAVSRISEREITHLCYTDGPAPVKVGWRRRGAVNVEGVHG